MEDLQDISDLSDNILITTNSSRFSDGDPAGIVYFARYPMYFDEAFIEIAKSHGFDWGQRDMRFIIPIVEQKTNFKQPLTVGREFKIVTAVLHKGNRSFQTDHLLLLKRNSSYHLSAHGYISRAVVDPKTFKAMKMPEELSIALDQYLVSRDMWEKVLQLFD